MSVRPLVIVAMLGGCGGGNTSAPAASAPPAVAPSPAPQEIRERVMERVRDVRRCLEGLLERAPGAEGTFTVAWHINADGGVSSARIVDATVGDDAMKTCVLGVFETMHFSASEKGADASWGFGLTPPAGK